MTEEFVRYLEMCVNFHHENDESFKITDSAYAKENLMYLKAIHYINELYSDVEENHTIEQNAGENQIEGGAVSISGSVKKQYRPYKDCEELIDSYKRKHCIVNNEDVMPAIWVKNNNDDTKRLITTFGKDFVKVGVKSKPVSLDVLYTDYEFLDGTPCGVNLEMD